MLNEELSDKKKYVIKNETQFTLQKHLIFNQHF